MKAHHKPRKAILLAAGFGARMRPLSRDLPKPLMPIWGVPAIEHTLAMVRRWGVRDVVVNAHHQAGALLAHLRQRRTDGLRISVSYEAEILGTGGALRKARWFAADEPFWIVNTDIAADVPCAPLLRDFRRHDPLAVLWLTDTGPRTVEVQCGRIRTLQSAQAGGAPCLTFTGVHLASARLFDYVADTAFSAVTDAYARAMHAGETVRGVTIPDSFWADVGTPERYIEVHRDILAAHRAGTAGGRLLRPEAAAQSRRLRRDGVRTTGFVSVSLSSHVERGAELHDSVVWAGSRVRTGAVLRNAVAGRGVNVRGSLAGTAVRASLLPASDPVHVALESLGWPAAATTVMPLPARGSDRTFTRLARGRRRVILVAYGRERRENRRHAGHARFLASRGVPVPAVLRDWPRRRLVLTQDAGDVSLQSAAPGLDERRLFRHYSRLLELMRILHHVSPSRLRDAGLPLEPSFSARLYHWEHELMTQHLLRSWFGIGEARIRAVTQDLSRLSRLLRDAPPVLVHRDLQSSNVLLTRRGPVLIDFQGMRMGPAVYDLASLLCDPYVMLPLAQQERLVHAYAGCLGHEHRIEDLFWPAAVQRLAQALGAFGRLAALGTGTSGFARHIPAGLSMMQRALARVEGLPCLRATVDELVCG